MFLINRLYTSGNHWVGSFRSFEKHFQHFVFSFSSLLASRAAANFS